MSNETLKDPGLDAEYRILREQCGQHGPAARPLLTFTGPEAGDYLQGQLTNDVLALEPGRGCYSALLDRKGKMQGEMRVVRSETERYELDQTGSGHAAISRHLQMYMIGREVSFEDESDAIEVITLIGPATVPALGGTPLGPEHSRSELRLAETDCVVLATAGGADILFNEGEGLNLAAALQKSGAEPVSREALELIRVERGIPRFGAEMSTETIPQEAGINERAVSFTKGCYIGQETVARLHYKGKPNRHLRGLKLEAPVEAGAAVRLGERELGTIGTAVISPAHGPIALAILRREAEPGTRVEVAEAVAAEVIDPPF